MGSGISLAITPTGIRPQLNLGVFTRAISNKNAQPPANGRQQIAAPVGQNGSAYDAQLRQSKQREAELQQQIAAEQQAAQLRESQQRVAELERQLQMQRNGGAQRPPQPPPPPPPPPPPGAAAEKATCCVIS